MVINPIVGVIYLQYTIYKDSLLKAPVFLPRIFPPNRRGRCASFTQPTRRGCRRTRGELEKSVCKKNKKSGETVAKELQGLVKLSLKPIHLIFVCLIRWFFADCTMVFITIFVHRHFSKKICWNLFYSYGRVPNWPGQVGPIRISLPNVVLWCFFLEDSIKITIYNLLFLLKVWWKYEKK